MRRLAALFEEDKGYGEAQVWSRSKFFNLWNWLEKINVKQRNDLNVIFF